MKTKLLIAAVSSFVILNSSFTARAQGSLTPPVGAPAPVMKSLDQLEPRTAITNRSSSFTITQPGSYYLTGNLTVSSGDGIVIKTNNVTLDLNGFTIASTSPTANGWGIKMDTLFQIYQNITIKNGFLAGLATNGINNQVLGGGFLVGLGYTGSPANDVVVSHLGATGISGHGISTGGTVENCSAKTCGNGLGGDVVRQCCSLWCYNGISGTIVSDCKAESTGGTGIVAEVVFNCRGESVDGIGIKAYSSVQNSVGQSTTGIGIEADMAVNCEAFSSSGSAALSVAGTASFCRGQRPSGTAINAAIAIGCTTSGGSIVSPSKQLGTP